VRDLRRAVSRGRHPDRRRGCGDRRELPRLRGLLRRLSQRRLSDRRTRRPRHPRADPGPVRLPSRRVSDSLRPWRCAGRPRRALPGACDRGAAAGAPPPGRDGHRAPRAAVRAVPVRAGRRSSGEGRRPDTSPVRAGGAGKRRDPATARAASESSREARAAGHAAGLPRRDAGRGHGTGGRVPPAGPRAPRRRTAELSGSPRRAPGESQAVAPRGVPAGIPPARPQRVRRPALVVADRPDDRGPEPGRAGRSVRGDACVHGLRRVRDALPDGRADDPVDRRRLRPGIPAVGVHRLPGVRGRVRAPGHSSQGDGPAGLPSRTAGGPAPARPEGDLPGLSCRLSG